MTCELCGGPSDAPRFDGRIVETPDGCAHLNYNVPSCTECREEVIAELEQRGLEQQTLNTFRQARAGGEYR